MPETESDSPLQTARQGAVLTLTLNRPNKRNALSSGLIAALDAGLAQAELDAEVRVVTIRGAGKDFCAGADLAELLGSAGQSLAENEAAALRLGGLFLRIRRLAKPVVALVHGRALAGGAGLAIACDMVLANATAQFGFPEIQRAFVPAMVMTLLRRHIGEKVAFDLVATGRLLHASEAMAAGLVSRVVPDAEFTATSQRILTELATASASAMTLTKRQLYELDCLPFEEGIRLGARINAMARSHPDFRAAIAGFLRS
jgi:methylglutaconyl-CoA hydratase